MKKIYILLLTLYCLLSFGQVGIGTVTPNNSAALDITSTTKGLLIPRVTQAQKTAIPSPVKGLLVYQTDATAGFWYFNGTVWTPFGGSSNNWDLTANSGTTPTTNKLGTLDNNPLILKANNTEAARILSNGNIGINNTTPTSKLNIKTTTTPIFTQNFESFTPVPYTISTNSADPIYTFATCTTATNLWRFNTTITTNYPCAGCSGNSAVIKLGTCTDQDATLVVKIGAFAEPFINVNFNYGYNYSLLPDTFKVDLYNETLNTIESTLVLKSFDAFDQTYSETLPITPGNNYSLRFRFIFKGTTSNLYGVQVDNITVIPQNPALRIEDGNQAMGFALISDANGNGTWTNPGSATPDDDWRFNSGSLDTDPIYRTGLTKVGYSGTARTPLDIYNNLGEGTQVGVGSNEYIVDGLNEFLVSNSIIPSVDNSISIGRSGLRWSTIYATNGVINTSDAREKEKIEPIKYGLSEIMQLQPVSYFWKKDVDPNPSRKIGFIAQDLQKVLPETVQDKEWTVKKGTLTQIKAEHLGVSYSEILPVVVKSIQENQVTLIELNSQIDNLIKKVSQENKK
ncbi:tail fiber domain-containing protein [Flavobacterium urocaniciphilum]|uniref:Chaperone of endosialidase n=1 Tax=Flavobacterium urocaniciphilum TaxID=1299341 RepID=A0A1H9ATN1_9FLAO|nr:tail fiber domain-containing protein [Flavobacterium urocaniciphilum]SEP80182.1 Chaperone of endosialidase [Flavobacterium urocaniciphilum]